MEKAVRKKTYQLKSLESLDVRMKLPYAQQQYLMNLKKGYQGESYFDDLIAQYLGEDMTVLTDLLIAYNGSMTQIDALVVVGDTFYLYEIKNYEGDYQKADGHFQKVGGQSFICPSVQLMRTNKVLQQMIRQWSDTIEIYSYVLFVNPSFTLFNVAITDPFILPSQITMHLRKLAKRNTAPSKGTLSILSKLKTEQKSTHHYRETFSDYTYDDLKKGIICSNCQSYNVLVTERRFYCKNCECKSDIEQLLLNNIEEIAILFPDMNITTSLVYEWTDGKVNKRRIGRFLKGQRVN